jgi:hypothetical protein
MPMPAVGRTLELLTTETTDTRAWVKEAERIENLISE